MTLEELWQLFPIILTEHNNEWGKWYEEELTYLKKYLPSNRITHINHIGSTSIDNIWAKPTIDILVEIRKEYAIQSIKKYVLDAGYLLMHEDKKRLSFNKGYTIQGFSKKVFHLHVHYEGDNDELYFRDYLRDHADIAKKYERLKLSLWKPYEHNRDAYTEKKTDFVKHYSDIARKAYPDRY